MSNKERSIKYLFHDRNKKLRLNDRNQNNDKLNNFQDTVTKVSIEIQPTSSGTINPKSSKIRSKKHNVWKSCDMNQFLPHNDISMKNRSVCFTLV